MQDDVNPIKLSYDKERQLLEHSPTAVSLFQDAILHACLAKPTACIRIREESLTNI
jgi:hypothetical protein